MRWPSLASDQSFQLWDEISSSHDAVPFYVFHMPTIEVTSQFQKEKFSEALVKRGSKNRPLDRETSSQCSSSSAAPFCQNAPTTVDWTLDSHQLIAAEPLACVLPCSDLFLKYIFDNVQTFCCAILKWFFVLWVFFCLLQSTYVCAMFE